jgi:hypothetical protein
MSHKNILVVEDDRDVRLGYHARLKANDIRQCLGETLHFRTESLESSQATGRRRMSTMRPRRT